MVGFFKKLFKRDKKKITSKEIMHIGRNDPCPCGSGKKYKKCCYDKLEKKKKYPSPNPMPGRY